MLLTPQQIIYISNQYTIYITLILLIIGIIGNSFNLLVFLISKIFHGNPCVFLLIILSIIDICQIVITLSSRILTDALGVDPTSRSIIWCRLRGYIAQTLTLTFMSTICFISFDQFLSTSYLFYLRNLSILKFAHRFLYITICLSLLHGIPLLIIPEIQSTKGCNIYNTEYFSYYMYFYFIGLIGLIPILISGVFSILAFYNINHIVRRQIPIARRRLDQQLTIIALLRTFCCIFLMLPYIIYRIYYYKEASTQNSLMKTAIIHLVGAFANSLIILNCSVK